MIDSKLCKHLWCENVLLNNILNYVLSLNTNFMIENEHVIRTKSEVKIVLEY
jgi:hypothetical protein